MKELTFERLTDALDRRLPARFTSGGDDDELRRARLALLFSFALTALAPVFVVNDLKAGRWLNAGIILSAVPFGVFAARVFRRWPSLTFMGNYVTTVFGAVLIARSLMTGGITAFAPFWMCSLPVMALLLAGRRSAFAWLGVCAAFFMGVLGATKAGVQWMDTWTIEERQREFVIATTMLCALMLMLSSLFEAAKEAMRRQVARREADIRRMLDVMGQGFITVSPAGQIIGPHSAALEQWFGAPRAGARFVDYLAAHDAFTANWLGLSFESVVDDLLPLEVVLDQFPHRVKAGARQFQLEVKPSLRRGALEALVLVLTDITSQLEREASELEQRELVAVLDKALSDRRGFLLFFTEGARLIADLAQGGHVRDVHTLKGNASLFGASTVASRCHALETHAAEQGLTEIAPHERAELVEIWKAFATRVARLVMTRNDVLEVPSAEIAQLRDDLQHHVDYLALEARVSGWVLEPVRLPLERLGEQARALAVRLGKPAPRIVVDDHDLRVHPDTWNPVWAVCVHLVRNSVDHGLDPAREGTLHFSAQRDDSGCVIELSDDGRGVDWERVALQARARALPADTRDDLMRALLSEGFSTATEVTEVSGRGFGLGAVATLCARLGGQFVVLSSPGQGTTFRLTLPAQGLSGGRSARALVAA
jgi:two-component sensor histidine kinase/HPt (histidine-containing phosphotransfer) domain-containing protein